MRQAHHWAALIFLATIIAHLCRVFFTGAFRRPREINWIIGLTMMILAMINGFFGYSLLDDQLSGSGLRIAYGVVLSIPVIGTWIASLFFGGEFPGADLLERFYALHILIVPAAIGLLIVRAPGDPRPPQAHPLPGAGPPRRQRGGRAAVADVHGQGHRAALPHRAPSCSCSAAWPRSTRSGSPGRSAWPTPAPPRNPTGTWAGSTARCASCRRGRSAPSGFDIPNPFFPGVLLPTFVFALLYLVPFIEAKVTKDRAEHHVLDRPRDRPVRTGARRGRAGVLPRAVRRGLR